MTKLLVVGNWKCNPVTLKEAKKLFSSVEKGINNIKKACPELNQTVEVVICPPFIYVSGFRFHVSCFKLGAQDCFWEEKGAFTGEISPKMLKDIGVKYVIIGHSERQKYFRETDEMINKKIKAVLEVGLKPILCVGESEKERKEGQTKRVLERQLNLSLKDVSRLAFHSSQLAVAYEPVWAISTSRHRKDCPPEEIYAMSLLLRKILVQKYGNQAADKIRILFGGNVNSQNAKAYFDKGNIQGFLVGGASLKPKEFIKIVKQI